MQVVSKMKLWLRGRPLLLMHLRIHYVNTGTVKESGEKHKGSVEIPNLSEENEVDDTEVGVTY